MAGSEGHLSSGDSKNNLATEVLLPPFPPFFFFFFFFASLFVFLSLSPVFFCFF